MTLNEFLKQCREVSAKACDNWDIDLYRSLNQPIQTRLPVEQFIRFSANNFGNLARALEVATKGLACNGRVTDGCYAFAPCANCELVDEIKTILGVTE